MFISLQIVIDVADEVTGDEDSIRDAVRNDVAEWTEDLAGQLSINTNSIEVSNE